jgi:ABC-type Na+ efflux pump permease subunit
MFFLLVNYLLGISYVSREPLFGYNRITYAFPITAPVLSLKGYSIKFGSNWNVNVIQLVYIIACICLDIVCFIISQVYVLKSNFSQLESWYINYCVNDNWLYVYLLL